jgi:hypothetical protein
MDQMRSTTTLAFHTGTRLLKALRSSLTALFKLWRELIRLLVFLSLLNLLGQHLMFLDLTCHLQVDEVVQEEV